MWSKGCRVHPLRIVPTEQYDILILKNITSNVEDQGTNAKGKGQKVTKDGTFHAETMNQQINKKFNISFKCSVKN